MLFTIFIYTTSMVYQVAASNGFDLLNQLVAIAKHDQEATAENKITAVRIIQHDIKGKGYKEVLPILA
jgi:hypothetical protein